jgi:phosphoenolpyruvate synthase/pyruvate phosphate dikinase
VVVTVEEQQYALSLEDVGGADVPRVGGKSANLGELAGLDVPVLPGFTTTAAAYDRFVAEVALDEATATLEGLDPDDVGDLQERGRRIRERIESAHESGRRVGICGDAPSTVPGYVEFLLDANIDSIGVTPDVVLQTILRVAELESDS